MKRKIILGVVVLTVLGLFLTNAPYQWLTQRTIDAVLVKEKQVSTESVKGTGKVESTYLIFTDHGVFRNDDAGWRLKYDSSDLYGQLDVGTKYRFTVYGWRIPIFSMYPNLVKAEAMER